MKTRKKRLKAQWKISTNPFLEEIGTILCSHLGYEIPIFVGHIYDSDEYSHARGTGAQVNYYWCEKDDELKIHRIHLTYNDLHLLLHEIIHVIFKVDANLIGPHAIHIKREEYLCEYYSWFLCGYGDKKAKKTARRYLIKTGYDLVPWFYEKHHEVQKARMMIEHSPLYNLLKEFCLK